MNILTDEEIKATLDKVSCCLEDRDITYSRAIEAAVLSKLAEQDVEPVGYIGKDKCNLESIWTLGMLNHFGLSPTDLAIEKLYTETQYIAVQQRTAEACAKVAANGVGTGAYNDCCPNTDWEDGQDAIASAIRNEAWREYL